MADHEAQAFEIMAAQLRTIAVVIAAIPIDELAAHCNRAGRMLGRAESIGALVDPTAYRNALADGSLDDAHRQHEIAKAILEVRRAVHRREDDRAQALASAPLSASAVSSRLQEVAHG